VQDVRGNLWENHYGCGEGWPAASAWTDSADHANWNGKTVALMVEAEPDFRF
jgi:hypothetical protein